MDKILSTVDIHARDRLKRLEQTLSNAVMPQRIRSKGKSYHGDVLRGSLGKLGIVLVNCSLLQVEFGSDVLGSNIPDEMIFCLQMKGEMLLRHAGQECSMGPRDMVLIDPMFPGEAVIDCASELLILKIPRADLLARVGTSASFIGRSVNSQKAESRVTSGLLNIAMTELGLLGSTAEGILETYVLDLIAVALSNSVPLDHLCATRAAWIVKIRAAIESHLSDPALNRFRVAALAGCSVRYANTLLAEHNLSLTTLLLQRRLARCKLAFDDPSNKDRSIREIASSWGFKDMTHFARRFAEYYGCLPTEYRKAR